MTPMIDVVFQLIIFFVVTLSMSEAKNEDIDLALGPHGPEIDTKDPMTNLAIVIEVDKKGGITIGGMPLARTHKDSMIQLQSMLQRRYNKFGVFPVMIRGDKATPHKYIKNVLDIVTASGIARVSFVAIKEKKEN